MLPLISSLHSRSTLNAEHLQPNHYTVLRNNKNKPIKKKHHSKNIPDWISCGNIVQYTRWQQVFKGCVLHLTLWADTPGTIAWPNAIVKLHMSLPPSFLWHLFLSAVRGYYGVYDLNTCLKSLCFVAQALFGCVSLTVWEKTYQEIHPMIRLWVWQAKIKPRNIHTCPVCAWSDAGSSGLSYNNKCFSQHKNTTRELNQVNCCHQ